MTPEELRKMPEADFLRLPSTHKDPELNRAQGERLAEINARLGTSTDRTSTQKYGKYGYEKPDSLSGNRDDRRPYFSLKEVRSSKYGSADGSKDPRPYLDSDSGSDSERPFAVSIHEFIKLPRKRQEPILTDAEGRATVGRHSLTLTGALGGQGKTTWFLDLGLHLAAGIDYPPWKVSRPVSILIIENEGPEELFAEKLEARLACFPHELKAALDIYTFDWGGFNLGDTASRERLTREISEKKYDLVFGDPLDSLGIEGVGSPEDTRKFLELMKQTGLNKTVAWWLNTHPRKEETREALNEIAGAWGGKPDTVFLLRLLPGDRTQIRQPKLRWAKRGKGPNLLMAFNPETEEYTFLGEESEEERDYYDEITQLLADGEWRVPREIAAPKNKGGIGASLETVQKELDKHPDVFDSRTGEDAKALGRRTGQAVVWQLKSPPAAAGADTATADTVSADTANGDVSGATEAWLLKTQEQFYDQEREA